MEEEGRKPLLATKYKGEYSEEIFNRAIDNPTKDERVQNIPLQYVDKELLPPMARVGKNARVSPASELLAVEMENSREKIVCTTEKSSLEFSYRHSNGYPSQVERHQSFAMPNGKASNKLLLNAIPPLPPANIEKNKSGSGQPHPTSLPMWPEVDARINGYKFQETPRRDRNGGEEQQEPSQWQSLGGASHRPVEKNDVSLSRLKDIPFKDAHVLLNKLESGLSSEDGMGDKIDEARRKQVPYSGSMGIFAYPGTPQRLFPGGQINLAGSPQEGHVGTGSPGYERVSISHSAAQNSGGRPQHRQAMKHKIPKVAPSKWDDADKWIASPSHNDSPATPSFRLSQGSIPGAGLQPVAGKRQTIAGQGLRGNYGPGSPEYATPNLESSISAQSSESKNVTELRNQDQQSFNSHVKALSFPDISKRIEVPHTGANPAQPLDLLSRIDSDDQTEDTPLVSNVYVHQNMVSNRLDDGGVHSRPALEPIVDGKALPDHAGLVPQPVDTPNASVKDMISNTVHSMISSFGRSTSGKDSRTDTQPAPSNHRDMGTQMTPVPSRLNSRCATPGLNPSPTRHNTPARSNRRATSLGGATTVDILELQSCHLQKLEHRSLGGAGQATLDRNSNWSTREEEEEESAACLRGHDFGNVQTGALEAWALAWEEAERARYTARFHQEEARIQAWEEVQKVKAEAQLRKVEMKLERMQINANEKMLLKIATAHRKAEDMMASAEALRKEHAAKATQRAEHIRQSGDMSTPLGCLSSCFVP